MQSKRPAGTCLAVLQDGLGAVNEFPDAGKSCLDDRHLDRLLDTEKYLVFACPEPGWLSRVEEA